MLPLPGAKKGNEVYGICLAYFADWLVLRGHFAGGILEDPFCHRHIKLLVAAVDSFEL